MLSARSLIVSVTALIAIALVIAVLGMRQERDSGGVGRDTYGVRAHGYRGVLEVLTELGIDARRRIAPPTDALPAGTTIAFLAPTPTLVACEPAYLHRVARWVKSGGRLVIAPPTAATRSRYNRAVDGEREPGPPEGESVLEAVGLGRVAIEGDETERSASAEEDPWPWSGRRESRAQKKPAIHTFESAASEPESLTIALPPGSVMSVDPGELDHCPLLQARWGNNSVVTIAASFPRGEGEIVVVADPDLFANALARRADNGVAAVRLLSPGGNPVVFDEHYHGLAVRGNPLYLLTQPRFAVLALTVMAAAAIWAWRTSISLGPPVVTRATPRRDLSEYVAAMGRLLTRGSDDGRYVLSEIRQGTLEELGRQLNLHAQTPSPNQVAAALARRDRGRADAFTETIDAFDRRLAESGSLRTTETTDLMQRASRCL